MARARMKLALQVIKRPMTNMAVTAPAESAHPAQVAMARIR